MTDEELTELVVQLREGVREVGLSDDNNTELFDVTEANEVMFEAAEAITRLTAERDAAFVAGAKAGIEAAAFRVKHLLLFPWTTKRSLPSSILALDPIQIAKEARDAN
jgi:hypothetical protein